LSRYSPSQLFDVVINCEDYKHFVPFVSKSSIQPVNANFMLATLTVDFKLGEQTYVSQVTFKKPEYVRV
jgi:ribosome-associated toxin RatA of RatAB toxin-antitoxin module